jgi:hypothetical protein
MTEGSERGRRAGRHVVAVAWRLLAVVAGLELLYLVVANTILWTPLLKKFAAQGDTMSVDYSSAYSVLPGRIAVRDLHLRLHDHNIEFLVQIERGKLDVSLHELLRKRFHALRVDGERVTYRMRHKLSKVGKEARRVAAYPPIPGFPDPPLFRGPPSPPIPDDQYNLWDVNIENVTAQVKEIWILEYRYRGPGLARGSFHVKPARNYEVSPTTLDLTGGRLTVGSDQVSERTTAHIRVVVEPSDTRKLQGFEPVEKIVADARGQFQAMDFRFLDVYLEPHAGASARGKGDLQFDLHLHHGALTPGSMVSLRADDVELKSATFGLGADTLSLGFKTEATQEGTRGQSELVLAKTLLTTGERSSTPFGAKLVADEMRAPMHGSEPPSAAVRLHVDRGTALLPLLTPARALRDIESSLLDIRELDAYAKLRGGSAPLLDLREVRAGVARAKGYYLARPGSPAGAFLISTPIANLGVRLTSEGTEWSPLVSDGWLSDEVQRSRGMHGRSQRGTPPRPVD